MAGFRPRATRFLRQAQDRLFCFGKRTQNHLRPGVALRVPLPRPRLFGLPSTSGALRLTLRMNGLSLPVHASLPFVLSVASAKSKGAQTVLAPKQVSGPGRSHARRRREMAPVTFSYVFSPPVILDACPRLDRGSRRSIGSRVVLFAFSFVTARSYRAFCWRTGRKRHEACPCLRAGMAPLQQKEKIVILDCVNE